MQWILDANVQISTRQDAFAAVGRAKTNSSRLSSLVDALTNQEGPVVYHYLRQNQFDVMNMLVRRKEPKAAHLDGEMAEQVDTTEATTSDPGPFSFSLQE